MAALANYMNRFLNATVTKQPYNCIFKHFSSLLDEMLAAAKYESMHSSSPVPMLVLNVAIMVGWVSS